MTFLALASLPYFEMDPIALQVGPIAIRWYALAYIAGIVGGWFYIARLLKHPTLWKNDPSGVMSGHPPMSRDQLDDLIFWITLGIIFGGRLGYVFFYEPDLLLKPWEPVVTGQGVMQTLLGWIHIPPALMIWHGGMSFHGGLIGVALAGYFFCRKNGLGILRVADLLALAAPIGLFFGRIANFINAELYGRPTDGPLGMVFPDYYDYGRDQWVYASDAVARHPSQLYEAALEGLALFIILVIASRVWNILKQPGAATGIFLIGYGVARTIVENFREPDAFMPDFPLGLTMGMMLSLPMVILGLWLFLLNRRPVKADPKPDMKVKTSLANKQQKPADQQKAEAKEATQENSQEDKVPPSKSTKS